MHFPIPTVLTPSVGVALLLASTALHAAGAHHAIEDAAMLAPGECQVESWVERARAAERRLAHVGANCRVGPVELGLSSDRSKPRGQAHESIASAQAKWVYALNERWGIGMVAGVSALTQEASSLHGTVLTALTWQAHESLAVHANIGRDLVPSSRDSTRHGMAIEWAASQKASLLAERFVENRTAHARLGLRWTARRDISLDISRAKALGGQSRPWWTIGANYLMR